ncbi:MAG: dTDP-4-dehydrorhamnose reductase [Vicinamibacterales bacterium]
MHIFVTGAAGQLGAVIVRRCREAGWRVSAATREEVDITRHEAVMEAAARLRPDVIANCAAFNDVDGAEDRAETALAVNAFAVRSLARAAGEHGATLVHYGTDFVFDGQTSRPYTELDRPRPQSVYASAKFLGDHFAQDAEAHYVLRVESLFGGPAARSSIDRIVSSLRHGRETRVFVDRTVSPSYVEDVAEATLTLLSRRAPYGLYHCVNSGQTTWHELARELARVTGTDESLLVPVRVADVSLKARRPVFAALDNRKLASVGVVMPTWQDAVSRYCRVLDRPRSHA